MIFLHLLPIGISLLLLAAHFFRGSHELFAVLMLIFIALPVIRRPWTARLLQFSLLLGALEWLRTLVELILRRSEYGQPVIRLSLILGGVAALSALSTLLLRTTRLRKWFNIDPQEAAAGRDHTGS